METSSWAYTCMRVGTPHVLTPKEQIPIKMPCLSRGGE